MVILNTLTLTLTLKSSMNIKGGQGEGEFLKLKSGGRILFLIFEI